MRYGPRLAQHTRWRRRRGNQSRRRRRRERDAACHAAFGSLGTLFEHALELLNTHAALEDTRSDALAWAEKAKDAMAELPQSELRDLLIDLAYFVVARLY